MYRCLNCKSEFDEPAVVENHYTYDQYYEIEEVCPFCNNYCEPIKDKDEV